MVIFKNLIYMSVVASLIILSTASKSMPINTMILILEKILFKGVVHRKKTNKWIS